MAGQEPVEVQPIRTAPDSSEAHERQPELYLGHLPHHILGGQPQVDAGGTNVSMSEVLLEGGEPAIAVQVVDSIAVPEEMAWTPRLSQARRAACLTI